MKPTIISGLKNLRVLKTTRSSFVDFVDDEYRSLPDMEDRLFRYKFNSINKISTHAQMFLSVYWIKCAANDDFNLISNFHSTNVSCAWEYSSIDNVDFDQTWTTVKEIILKNFAGDPVEGVPSPSVQNTIYLSQKDILAAISEVN